MSRRVKDKKFTTPEYAAWCRIRSRCNNPNVRDYKHYGGRGIKVCKRWDSYDRFLADMGKRPDNLNSLDRIDNNGDYKPSNCRWADSFTQNSNRRNNNNLTFKGKTLNISQWARELGIKRSTLYMRFYKYNWSTERCLGEGVQK